MLLGGGGVRSSQGELPLLDFGERDVKQRYLSGQNNRFLCAERNSKRGLYGCCSGLKFYKKNHIVFLLPPYILSLPLAAHFKLLKFSLSIQRDVKVCVKKFLSYLKISKVVSTYRPCHTPHLLAPVAVLIFFLLKMRDLKWLNNENIF